MIGLPEIWQECQKSANPSIALNLYHQMCDASYDLFSAGWRDKLEFLLWKDTNCPDLRELADQCGGWWMWPDESPRVLFIPIDEWLEQVKTQEAIDRHKRGSEELCGLG